jgi:hypothetical protein
MLSSIGPFPACCPKFKSTFTNFVIYLDFLTLYFTLAIESRHSNALHTVLYIPNKFKAWCVSFGYMYLACSSPNKEAISLFKFPETFSHFVIISGVTNRNSSVVSAIEHVCK